MRAILPAFLSAALGVSVLCAPARAGIELLTEPEQPSNGIDLDVGEYLPFSGTQIHVDDAEVDAIRRACDEKAAHPGNTDNPEGVEGVSYNEMDGARALPACLKAVEVSPGDLRMRYQLARAKQASGQGRDAIVDLMALADEGYVAAINNLGATYQLGIGVAKDFEKALEWYENAAGKGFVPSMAVAGWMHHTGLGTPQDYEKALGWYRKAADVGSASAMHNLGFMYHNGWGVEKDADEAAQWFRKAAELGFGKAMSMTAWTYQVGRGAPVDGDLAIKWYEKAAEAGEISAFGALGGLYESGGSGLARAPDKAADWLMQAVQKRDVAARDRLIENHESLHIETRRAIQARLAESGFDPGPIDGVFGQETLDAIAEAFEGP